MNAVHDPASPSYQNGSMTALLAGIVHDAQRLISQQLELLKVEIKEELWKLAISAAFIAVGAGLLLMGGLLLAFMAVYLLDWAFPSLGLWLCFLIVGGGLTLAGSTAVAVAVMKLSALHPLPDQSLQGLKENLQWRTNLR
jgi:hypothetical protein